MQEWLLGVAGGAARFVLVVTALAVALGSIALTGVRGFCTDPAEAAGTLVAAAAVVRADATAPPTAPPTEAPPTAPATDAPTAPGTDGPVDEGSSEPAPGECPAGSNRCLPPLFSSVLQLGADTDCVEQGGERLRARLVPAAVVSVVLLGGAWLLRPRHDGEPVRD